MRLPLLLALILVVPVAFATSAAFTMDATNCRETLVMVPTGILNARRFVPEEYRVLGEQTGNAVAFVALKKCDDLILDGVSVGPASTADAGILIQSPDRSSGLHYYQSWWYTDNAALWSKLSAQGWVGALVPGGTVSGPVPNTMGAATFDIPYAKNPLSATASVYARNLPPTNEATGWQSTPTGTMTVHKFLASTEFGAGVGTVQAQLPTKGSALIAGPSATGVAMWNVYGMTGTVGPQNIP